MKLTLKAAQAQLAYCRMTISKHDGEYRVNFAGQAGTEESAYYTPSIEDAVESGMAMASAAYIRDEDSWPNWPICPMKRRPKGKSDSHPNEVGTLMKDNESDTPYTVFLLTMFQRITEDTPKLMYASEHAVIADGWRVD